MNTARAGVLRAGHWPDALKRNVRFLKRIGTACVDDAVRHVPAMCGSFFETLIQLGFALGLMLRHC